MAGDENFPLFVLVPGTATALHEQGGGAERGGIEACPKCFTWPSSFFMTERHEFDYTTAKCR